MKERSRNNYCMKSVIRIITSVPMLLFPFFRSSSAKRRTTGCESAAREAGFDLQRSLVECVGAGMCMPGLLDKSIEPELLETVLRVTVADPRREAVERFTKEMS